MSILNPKYRLIETDYVDIPPLKNFFSKYIPPMPRVYRIQALRDLPRIGVKAGDLGGYVESESNLSHSGDCWIFDEAKVYFNVQVRGNAQIRGKAVLAQYHLRVEGNAVVIDGRIETDWYAEYYYSQSLLISGFAHLDGDFRCTASGEIGGAATVLGKVQLKREIDLFGNAQICDEAILDGKVRVYGNAIISGKAAIRGRNEISGFAKVKGNAILAGRTKLSGSVCLLGKANVSGKQALRQGVISAMYPPRPRPIVALAYDKAIQAFYLAQLAENGRCSVTALQRQFQLGFNRAIALNAKLDEIFGDKNEK